MDECMCRMGGFEGNAQTIRIITRLEKKEKPEEIVDANGKDNRVGLNLTARVIASALKYDKEIPLLRKQGDKLCKGYYGSEKEVIQTIKECLIEKPDLTKGSFKTIECSIMDFADDIAYSTYDVEDAFKAGFLTPYEMFAADDRIFEEISKKIIDDKILSLNDICTPDNCRAILLGVFADAWLDPVKNQEEAHLASDFRQATIDNFLTSYQLSKKMASDGYFRTQLTSNLVNSFINGVSVEIDQENPVLSKAIMDDDTLMRVNVLKRFANVAIIDSSRLCVVENRGKEIVKKMFDSIYGEKGSKGDGFRLLPEDTKKLYHESEDELWKARVVCDFIAGMTDRYASEFYGRLFSENPQTIFKPI